MFRLSRRELGIATALLASTEAASAGPQLAGARDEKGGPIDPELKAWIDAGGPAMTNWPSVAQLNAQDDAVVIEERLVPGARAAPRRRLLVLTPKKVVKPAPIFFFIHGGGFVGGSPETALRLCRGFAERCGCVVVMPTYRLAPQTPFPGALEDLYAALIWTVANGAALGGDIARLGVGGISAGGGHAAALNLLVRDRKQISVAFQLLSMPMLDDRTGVTRDPGPMAGNILWTRESNREGWRALLTVDPGGARVPAYAVPARFQDLSGLPPTFIGVGQLDLFVDENIEYAQRLMRAGIATELFIAPGAFHGFDSLVPEAQVSKRYVAIQEAALRKALDCKAN